MTTVFIAGSTRTKELHSSLLERLSDLVQPKFKVIIGDAKGVDSLVQERLHKLGAKNVTVYCTNDHPRNNVGNWSVKKVYSKEKNRSRAFFTAKDKQMAKDSDFGLMLWDFKSTGTLNNILELTTLNKKCVVYIDKDKKEFNVNSHKDAYKLIALMDEKHRKKAGKKIHLNSSSAHFRNEQQSLLI